MHSFRLCHDACQPRLPEAADISQGRQLLQKQRRMSDSIKFSATAHREETLNPTVLVFTTESDLIARAAYSTDNGKTKHIQT